RVERGGVGRALAADRPAPAVPPDDAGGLEVAQGALLLLARDAEALGDPAGPVAAQARVLLELEEARHRLRQRVVEGEPADRVEPPPLVARRRHRRQVDQTVEQIEQPARRRVDDAEERRQARLGDAGEDAAYRRPAQTGPLG